MSRVVVGVVLGFGLGLGSAFGNPGAPGWWDTQARVLAGLPLDAAVTPAAVRESPAVRRHAASMDEAWQSFRSYRLIPGQKFAAAEVARHRAALGPIFYPFGGPDGAWPLTLFPDAQQFLLIGLEPPGQVPDLSAKDEANLDRALAQVRRSLQTAIRYSFFKTIDMNAELPANKASGVLPLLMTMIARQGFAIEGVSYFNVAPDGQKQPTRVDARPQIVQIVFRPVGGGDSRTLSYLRADLSNGGLASAPEIDRFLDGYRHRATFLKAASYLMHSPNFSAVRDRILTRSALVLQDDSGVPFRSFDEASWNRKLYGMYDGPIQLFARKYQQDLRKAYDTNAQPLPFGIGYDHRSKTSNLQLFVRTSDAISTGAPR